MYKNLLYSVQLNNLNIFETINYKLIELWKF